MSFLDDVNPNRPRKRLIDWPMGGGRKLEVRILNDSDLESAYLATKDHFKAIKKAIDYKDPAFQNRERAELVLRAFSATDGDNTPTGEPIAPSVDALVKHPPEVIDALFAAHRDYQVEAAAKPINQAVVRELIEELKKNTPAAALHGLPSSWLIAVITTLVAQSSSSATLSATG